MPWAPLFLWCQKMRGGGLSNFFSSESAAEEFTKIKPFPDPVPKDNKPFDDIHSTNIVEEYTPILQRSWQKGKSLSFYASVQHVKNSGVMLLCDQCGMGSWYMQLESYGKVRSNYLNYTMYAIPRCPLFLVCIQHNKCLVCSTSFSWFVYLSNFLFVVSFDDITFLME